MDAKIDRVIETILYVDDIALAQDFYSRILGLTEMLRDERFAAYDIAGKSTLLIFKRGDSIDGKQTDAGYIPPHDGHGPHHIGLAISNEQLPIWEQRLADYQIEIEGRMDWKLGGKSLYFRDPDGNMLELVTPGIWPNY